MSELNKNSYLKISFKKVKSNYILKEIFNDLHNNKTLEIIRYNKYIQKRINKDIHFFKKYLQIVIEIIPTENKYGYFINISNNNDRHYYHIYFNDNENEIQRKYITEEDNVTKIKIVIDYEIKNLYGLFRDCKCIKKMNFIQFNRKVNEDMSYLFSRYSSIEEITFSNFKTDNVTNMSYMFYECSSLTKLTLSNFNTKNVTDMRGLFYGCISLKEINFIDFNTSNVSNMSHMFFKCSSLKELNLYNINIDKVKEMNAIFDGCSSLKINCSDELKEKIIECGYKKFFRRNVNKKIIKDIKLLKPEMLRIKNI